MAVTKLEVGKKYRYKWDSWDEAIADPDTVIGTHIKDSICHIDRQDKSKFYCTRKAHYEEHKDEIFIVNSPPDDVGEFHVKIIGHNILGIAPWMVKEVDDNPVSMAIKFLGEQL